MTEQTNELQCSEPGCKTPAAWTYVDEQAVERYICRRCEVLVRHRMEALGKVGNALDPGSFDPKPIWTPQGPPPNWFEAWQESELKLLLLRAECAQLKMEVRQLQGEQPVYDTAIRDLQAENRQLREALAWKAPVVVSELKLEPGIELPTE